MNCSHRKEISNMSNKSASREDTGNHGLYLNGFVIDRTRRHVPKNNPTTEIVTYTVSDNFDRKYYVDDYAPAGYYEIGEYISVPVYVKPYTKKNGDVSYNLSIQKKTSTRGEHF